MRSVFAAMIALSVTSAGASAATITNASFETPSQGVNGFTYSPAGSGWSFNQSGIAATGPSSSWFNVAAANGTQAAFLQSYNGTIGSISQTVTGLSVGMSYTFSFFDALRPGVAANPITVTFNGANLGTFTPGSTTFTQVTTTLFTATGAQGVLAFTGVSTQADFDSLIDQVTIAQLLSDIAEVPEPVSIALLLGGVAATATVRRKRA